MYFVLLFHPTLWGCLKIFELFFFKFQNLLLTFLLFNQWLKTYPSPKTNIYATHISWHMTQTIVSHAFTFFGHTTLWATQSVRSSCWISMFNGIRPEPTDKRLNSASLQIYFLICRKIHSITFWLDKTVSCRSQVTMMFSIFFFF